MLVVLPKLVITLKKQKNMGRKRAIYSTTDDNHEKKKKMILTFKRMVKNTVSICTYLLRQIKDKKGFVGEIKEKLTR